MIRWILPILLSLIATLPVTAQEVWSLQRCIQTGLDANLSVQAADLGVEGALLERRRWDYAMLPTVNGNVNFGYQFGRTIDPTSNAFIETTTSFSQGSLNATLVVFDGFRIRHSREQARFSTMAQKASADDARNNAALQIATAYINVLFAEEQLEVTRQQRLLAQQQLDQIDKLVNAGLRAENERFPILSQVAQNDYQVILQENARDQAYLTLKQTMMVDPATNFRVARPDVDPAQLDDPTGIPAEALYQQALQQQPIIQAVHFQEKSAEKGVSIARSGLIPSIRLFGGLTTAYSNNFLDFQNPDISNAQLVPGTPQRVIIDGEDKFITPYVVEGLAFNPLPFMDQIDRNFGKNVGVNLSVPLYNNHQSRIGMQQARVNLEQARLQTEQTRQQLKTTIESAAQAARAARLQYIAASEALDAQRTAFEVTSRRFELGAANLVEFTNAKTNLDLAQNQWIIGKYEYLFRMKILDFYMGKPLTL
jgi:outer membrane protein